MHVIAAEECLEISRFCKQNKDAYCQMTFSNFSYHMLMNKGNLREAMIALELYAEALHLVCCLVLFIVKKGCFHRTHNGRVGELAAREPTCTGNRVTEVGHYPASSPPSPSPGLKRVRYPLSVGWQEKAFQNSFGQIVLNLGPCTGSLWQYFRAFYRSLLFDQHKLF